MITNDFKNKLLKYITGNIDFVSVENKPYFEKTKKIYNNLYKQIENEINENFNLFNIIEGKSQGNGLGIIALYGEKWGEKYEDRKGLIVLVDMDFRLIQIITKYDTGEDIGIISDIYQDNENNIYIIEKTNKYRIIYTNNFFIKPYKTEEYIIKNNKVLYLPDELQYGKDFKIKKDYESANYLIVGTIPKDENDLVVSEAYPIAAKLKVNVGEENEWKIYNFDYTPDIPIFLFTDFYVEFDENGNEKFNITGFIQNGFVKKLVIFKNNYVNEENTQLIFEIIENFYTDYELYNESALIVNLNLIYSAITILNRIEIYKYDGNTNNKIYTYFIENREERPIAKLFNYENEIFFIIRSQYKENNLNYYRIEVGKIFNNEVLLKEIKGVPASQLELFFVSKQFNLYNYMIQTDDYMYLVQQIYNENNFNAIGENNETSLQGNSVQLFNKDNRIIYARNLYNRLVQKNITISTIQIPNIMLNDIEIYKENLLSNTNNIINEETTKLQKNQFEEVLINFINTIIVEDRNIEKSKFNRLASSRINDSISNKIDYNNSKISKYKINYQNGNFLINQISEKDIIYLNNTAKFFISFETKIENPVTKIEILSNDNKTIYLTIDVSNLEKNKKYKIEQEMEVL